MSIVTRGIGSGNLVVSGFAFDLTVEAAITGEILATFGNMACLILGKTDTVDTGPIMASRIVNILVRARDTLADPGKDRWSDDRLLRLLDEGQQDIAKQSQLLKGTFDLALSVNQAIYSLPENLWLITRVTYDDYEIPLLSYDHMDEQARKEVLADRNYDSNERRHGYNTQLGDAFSRTNWETVVGGAIEAVIFDNREMQDIRVYPIPNDSVAQNEYTFQNPDTVEFNGDEVLGVATSIDEYTQDSVFGAITSLFDPTVTNEVFSSVFGVTTSISESDAVVKFWYIKLPEAVTDMSDNLETPAMFDVALKHYIVGHALRDDLDVQYRDMAAESFALYERELDLAKGTNRTDGTRNAKNHTTTYRGGFE